MNWYTFLPALLNMSVTAGVVILFVIFARLLLRKAPKIFSYVLWYVVLFRLFCPVAIGSPLSLLGILDAPAVESHSAVSSIEYIPTGRVSAELPKIQMPIPGVSDGADRQPPKEAKRPGADIPKFPAALATGIWGAGFLAMAVYSVAAYWGIRRKLKVVIPLRDNIFIADDISSPFVIGFFRPGIYLPCGLGDKEQEYIILHEQHHIRRFDHIVKALAFLALCIHWFNPLVWLAFILAGRDMEMSCDEAVIRKIGVHVRADYSASLLALATGQRRIAGTPLAFGEGDTGGRIRNLANWRKPRFWVVLAAVAGCTVLAVCLLTNPTGSGEQEGKEEGERLGVETSENVGNDKALTASGDGKDNGAGAFAERIWHENGAVVTAHSDLDHDGESENVVVRTVVPDQVYEVAVEKEDGTQIWTAEASPAHVGWNTIMLYSEGGQDYLVQYLPAMFQGMGSYTCTVFSLEGGRETVKEEWSVDFVLPAEETLEWTPEMTRFSEEIDKLLRKSIVLLSTEQGILVEGPVDASALPQLYPVHFDLNETQSAIDKDAADAQETSPDVAGRPDIPLEMLFASGAGAWGTTLTLQPDGTFSGDYSAHYMDENTAEYPYGTIYVCQFSGRFSELTQINNYAFSMELEELTTEEPAGKEWIEDNIRYITSDPLGMEDGEEFILYAPGTPADELSEEFRDWWPGVWRWRSGELSQLNCWGLCNVNTGQGFFNYTSGM